MERNIKKNLAVHAAVSLLILFISSGASLLSIRKLLESNFWVNHTYEVISNLNKGEAMILSSQNSVRGFLLTGDESFIGQYAKTENASAVCLENVQELTADNPKQQKNIKKLSTLRIEFFSFLSMMIHEKQLDSSPKKENLELGRSHMEAISSQMSLMEEEEKKLFLLRTSKAEDYSTFSLFLIAAAGIAAVIITVMFFIRTLRESNKRLALYRELENSNKETAHRIKVISDIAGEISKGNYKTRISDKESDALGSVAASLNNMADGLENSFELLSKNEWLQRGAAQLGSVLRGDKDLGVLASDITSYLCTYTGSSAGVFYSAQGSELFFEAGYSYIPAADRQKIAFGQGLTGQAAEKKEILQIRSIPQNDIVVSYALGELQPRHILAVPFVNNETVGIIELASVDLYTENDLDFLNLVSQNIAIALISAKNRKKMQELLEETQAQAEELMVQHSELESINEELEAQSEKLQASEEELKVQHEEIQQTNEELLERGRLLSERNAEIQKKSEELALSTRYKSEFLANMSHELRTPLNSILLLSRLLAENTDASMSAEQIEFARVIQSSGKGLLSLIDEILDLSQIEAGKMNMEIEAVSTEEISNNMLNLFKEVARDKKITFEIENPEGFFTIHTDRQRLEQVLKNLISNALKFTSKGRVVLKIMNGTEQSSAVSFQVSDTGIGIAPEKQESIFEAFQQGDGSTKRKFGGTGLGLSISRELAKLLGGSISLQSIQGEGSTFSFTIPFSAAQGEAEMHQSSVWQPLQADAETGNESDEPSKYLSSFTPEPLEDDRDKIKDSDQVILIVEDDVVFARYLLDFTRMKGYLGIVCVDGSKAVQMALQYSPKGILLDIQLPGKDGWQVMEELKNNTVSRHIPVHIMSSHRVKKRSLLEWAAHFLEKPVSDEELSSVFLRIEYLLGRESHKVLIIEDNEKHASALAGFLQANEINSAVRHTLEQGMEALSEKDVDCVILDMGMPYEQCYDVLEVLKTNPGMEHLPIIVFTGKSLSQSEEQRIRKYADSIIVKTADSYRRMLDEVSLFLHVVERSKSASGQKAAPAVFADVLAGKKVLIADDDIRNIYSFTKVLEDLKMKVATAMDGREALEVLAGSTDIDIILLDMMMPNMDGYETARQIRADKRFRNMPIIAVTAKAMNGDRQKCIEAGADDYITKPIDTDQLASLLRVWLFDQHRH